MYTFPLPISQESHTKRKAKQSKYKKGYLSSRICVRICRTVMTTAANNNKQSTKEKCHAYSRRIHECKEDDVLFSSFCAIIDAFFLFALSDDFSSL
jgi:hypothetical protein